MCPPFMRRIKKLAAAVLFCCFAGTVHAQATCSYSDVSTAVSGAARNATINVPAGSCSWSSTLTLTQGITLLGAGSGSTIITYSGSGGATAYMVNVNPDATAITNDETIKISGFTFNANNIQVFAIIRPNGGGLDNGTKPFKNLIITNNILKNTNSASGGGNAGIFVTGQFRGVVSGNTFDRVDMPFRVFGADDLVEWSNSAYNNFSYGSADNLYFENNTIQYSSSYTSTDNNAAWIEVGQGGRVVVRFNTWNEANIASGAQELWDIHGFQNYDNSPNGQTGTMVGEYYDNTVTNVPSTFYRWEDVRSSQVISFNNTISAASTPDIEVNQYGGTGNSDNTATSGCYNQIQNPNSSAYTGPDGTVNNTYFINNTVNGTVSNAIGGTVNACGVTENGAISAYGTGVLYGWWNQNASCSATTTCTAGVGVGSITGAPTSTCTTGVGYWATNQGNWNHSGSGGQGVLYKCTATNTWTLYYTPYAYPDPLLGGSPAPSHGKMIARATGVTLGTVSSCCKLIP